MLSKKYTSDFLFKIHYFLLPRLGEHKELFAVSLMTYLFIVMMFSQLFLIPIEMYMLGSWLGASLYFPCLFLFLSIVGFIIVKHDNRVK